VAPSAAVRRSVPVRTFSEWGDPAPGFVEADLVAHSGPSTVGSFVQTLTLTDIAGGLNRSTQHFILKGKDGVYGDGLRISSRFHCGREDGIVGSLAARGVAESDWARVW
jgi:hypothetical protein